MSSTWGAYHAAIAAIETPSPTASLERETPRREEHGADCEERDREVRQRPGPDDSTAAECDDRPRSVRSQQLERHDDDHAHGEKGDPVAARLSREVEEQGRRCREKEKQEPGEHAVANVQPDGHEGDSGDERHRRSEAEKHLVLADERARGPAEQAEELVIVGRVGAGEDPARASSNRIGHGGDLVAAVPAVPEAVEARPHQDRTEDHVRRHDDDARQMSARTDVRRGRAHVTRQRNSVRMTRTPSKAVSFLPASRPRAV